MTIDELSKRNSIDINREKFRAGIGEGRIGREKVILMKPLTYMNNSGMAVLDCANYYDIDPEDIIVITDDIDIPWGSIRIKQGFGGKSQWNEINNLPSKLTGLSRVKISVGKKIPQMDLADFVLSNFTEDEQRY